jgi:hypothetical protein
MVLDVKKITARSTLYVCLLATACDRSSARLGETGWQGFSLGAMPLDVAERDEQRYIVTVPRRFIDDELLPKTRIMDDRARIVANNIRFGVFYPSLRPALDPWAKGAIRVEIGNMAEDGISGTVDGSRLSYYSGYNAVLPDRYGLHARRRTDFDPFGDRLYFGIWPHWHVRIECKGNVHEADKWCVMAARRPGEPFIETGFYSAQMPHWRERLGRLRALFRSEGRQALRLAR